MTSLVKLSEENRNLTVHETGLAWSVIRKEQERLAKLAEAYDDRACCGGSCGVRIAEMIRGGQ